ncbi:hypothetical protein, partial [Streptococcus acidominimus]|uniref:hypothetical protein n=1 Tax=Streptococcus acidominimus TaxID=1326 RepID=UPI001F5A1C2F
AVTTVYTSERYFRLGKPSKSLRLTANSGSRRKKCDEGAVFLSELKVTKHRLPNLLGNRLFGTYNFSSIPCLERNFRFFQIIFTPYLKKDKYQSDKTRK